MNETSSAIDELLKQGLELHQAEDFESAAACYGQVLDHESGNPAALHLLGLIHYAQGDMHKAVELVQRAIVSNANEAVFHFNLGNIYRDAGELENAIVAFENALALQPDEPDYHNNLGDVFELQGRLEQARDCYQHALSLRPDDAEFYFNLGNVQRSLDESDLARTAYQHALELSPDYWPALVAIADLLADLGERDQAIAHYKQALQLEPQNAHALNNLGGLLQAAGYVEDALDCYRKALEVEPELAEAHRNIAGLLQAGGEREAAIAHYQEALRLKPDYAEVEYKLASLRGDQAPTAAPADYVAALFDQYADDFDEHLTGVLEYRTPQALRELFNQLASGTGLRVLDLGCGTGLSGVAFKELAQELAGVDLSPRMIDKARARGIYDELSVAEVVSALSAHSGYWDLLVAADVFVYIGDCDAVLAAAATSLRPGGWLLFSVEQGGDEDFTLREAGRYAHGADYFQNLADRHGFNVRAQNSTVLRKNLDVDVHGWLYAMQAKD